MKQCPLCNWKNQTRSKKCAYCQLPLYKPKKNLDSFRTRISKEVNSYIERIQNKNYEREIERIGIVRKSINKIQIMRGKKK